MILTAKQLGDIAVCCASCHVWRTALCLALCACVWVSGRGAEGSVYALESPCPNLAPSDTSETSNGAPFFPQVEAAWVLKHCTMYSEEVFPGGVGARLQDSNLEYSGEAACPIQHG